MVCIVLPTIHNTWQQNNMYSNIILGEHKFVHDLGI